MPSEFDMFSFEDEDNGVNNLDSSTSNIVKTVGDDPNVQKVENAPKKIEETDNNTEATEDVSFQLFDLDDENIEYKLNTAQGNQQDAPKINDKVLQALIKDLVEEGVLDADDDAVAAIKSTDDIKSLMQKNIASKELSDLNDDQKQYLELLRAGVSNAVAKQYQSNVSNLNNVTDQELETEEVAELLYKTLLKVKGFDEVKIGKYVERARETNTLIEEGKDSLAELKTIENVNITKQKEQVSADKVEKQKRINEDLVKVKNTLETKNLELIPGIKVTDIEKKQLLKNLTQPVSQDASGRKLDFVQELSKKDPVNFKLKLHYLALKGFFDTKSDLSFLGNINNSRKVNNLEKVLASSSDGGFSSGGYNVNNNNDPVLPMQDILDGIRNM